MKLFLLFLVSLIGLPIYARFNDTIIKKTGEQIICEITLVNELNIFYNFNPKSNRLEFAYIQLEKVKSYTKNSSYFRQIQAQEKANREILRGENTVPQRKHMSWIYRINNTSFKAHIKKTTDSSLIIIANPYSQKRKSEYNISYTSIDIIKVRDENRIGKGIGIGFGVGGLVGGLVGYSTGKDKCGTWDFYCIEKPQAALVLGIFGGIVGLGIGTIAGLTKITIPINGNANSYRKQRKSINKYLTP